MSKLTLVDEHTGDGLDRSEAALLEHLSDRFSRRNSSFLLSFPEPLEQSFLSHWEEQTIGRFRSFCVLSLGVLCIFGFIDSWQQPSVSAAIWEVRLPILAILTILTVGAYIKSLANLQIVGNFVAQLAFCVGGWSFFAMSTSQMQMHHYAIALLWPLMGLVLSGCLFKWALVMAASSLVLSNLYLSFWLNLEGFSLITHSLYFIAGGATALYTIYTLEKSQRDIYLQIQQNHLLKFDSKELEANRGQLRFLVALDPVTGIANRKSFDRALKIEWERSARKKQSLSLLLIDLDQFKDFNKKFGQKIADEWMQKVAVELKRFARRPGDIAARFADDSFVVLLADTEGLNAGVVAENIAKNIETLRDDSDLPGVSVCIGVATIIPSPKTFPADLIGESVCALNAAKKQGTGKIYNLASHSI